MAFESPYVESGVVHFKNCSCGLFKRISGSRKGPINLDLCFKKEFHDKEVVHFHLNSEKMQREN